MAEPLVMPHVLEYPGGYTRSVGPVIGRFRPTGVRPRFAERLKIYGMQLPRSFFEEVA